jgi:multicomponent Na+:H+ antiporter subunit G
MGAIELLSGVLLLCGAAYFFAGTVGVLRFPDVYSRLHALTKGDNVGLGLTVLGLALRADSARVRSASCCSSGCWCCWPGRPRPT